VIKIFDEEIIDVLKEVSHVGAGNASKALSKMTGKRIEVEFPYIKFVDIKDISEKFGGGSTLVASVFLDVKIENNDSEKKKELGKLVFMLDYSSAKNLSSYLTESESSNELSEMEKSALKETGNIITGSCLTAITEYIDVRLYEEVPNIKIDFLGALMDHFILPIARERDEALVFKTRFNFDEKENAYFLFLFHPESEEFLKNRLDEIS